MDRAINNESWEYYNTAWNNIQSGLIIGKTYHMKIVAKCSSGKADFYLDGMKLISDASFRAPATGIRKIAFGNYGYGTVNTTWYIDNVRLYPQSATVTSISYDPVTLQPVSKSDENGSQVYYSYDSFQRLKRIADYQHQPLESYSYYYSRSGNGNDLFNPSDPNYTEVKKYKSASDSTDEKSFTDGLGRSIQNQVQSDNGKTIISSTTIYDNLGRIDKVYKPYERTLSGYDPSYSLHDSTYYNAEMGDYRYNTGQIVSNLYSQNLYFPDPLGRISNSGFPGSTWRVNGGHDKRFTYTNATGNLYKSVVTDEQGIVTETYKDSFGRTTKTIQDVGSGKLNLTTTFSYDMLDNLKSSTDPSGKQTSYSYNTLKQLTSKTSPDAGQFSICMIRMEISV